MTAPERLSRIVPALASALGDAVAALLGESTSTSQILNGGEAGWTAEVVVQGAIDGAVTIGLSDEDARRVSGWAAGPDASPGDAAVLDALRGICTRAIAALGQTDTAAGLRLAVSDVARADAPVIEAEHAFEFSVGGTTMRLFMRATLAAARPEAAPEPAAAPRRVPVSTQNLDVLLDVELPVSVRFGQAELPLQALMRLAPGSVVDLHRMADEPVDVLVSGKVIARGEVVVVEGNYGVRVLQIVSAAERIRSLGA